MKNIKSSSSVFNGSDTHRTLFPFSVIFVTFRMPHFSDGCRGRKQAAVQSFRELNISTCSSDWHPQLDHRKTKTFTNKKLSAAPSWKQNPVSTKPPQHTYTQISPKTNQNVHMYLNKRNQYIYIKSIYIKSIYDALVKFNSSNSLQAQPVCILEILCDRPTQCKT